MSVGITPKPVDLPDRRDFWRWVWASVRPIVGWLLALLGAIALFLGYWGVAHQALTAKQLPYLVSGGLVGIALIVVAGVVLATEDWRRQISRLEVLERKVDELHLLLTTDVPVESPRDLAELSPRHRAALGHEVVTVTRPAEVADGAVLALPTGSVFHRPGCALIANKPAASPVNPASIAGRRLAPCRVCDPVLPAAVAS